MDFVIEKGNIVKCKTDAIVLPANKYLKEGSGASRAIFSAAGRIKLTQECKRIGECDLGMAVPTPGYKLSSKYIIHAVVPQWIDGNHNEYEFLSSAYISALNIADIMKCESIAFPILSAGNNGFDRGLAIKIAIESVRSFESKNLNEVKLIVFTDEMAVFAKSQGLDVLDSDYEIERKKKKEEVDKLMDEGKMIVQEYVKEAVKKGLDYLKDPENIERIINMGVDIVKKAKAEME